MPAVGLNAAFTLLSNATGIRIDPYFAFNFFVEIQGILSGGFSEVSGLQAETETQEYAEGGLNNYVHRFAGRTRWPALTLKHGLTPIDGLWLWHQRVVQGNVIRLNGTIYLLNEMRFPVLWWNFKNAFPSKWTGPDLRAGSSDIAFESIELVHEGLSRPMLGSMAAGLGAGAAGLTSVDSKVASTVAGSGAKAAGFLRSR
jgi:phage tail-like protein